MNGRNCGDCGGQLEQIAIMDQRNAMKDTLEYRAMDAPLTFWGTYRTRGSILAFACLDCRRVYLYASEYEDPKKRKASSDPKQVGRLSLSEAGGLSTPDEDSE